MVKILSFSERKQLLNLNIDDDTCEDAVIRELTRVNQLIRSLRYLYYCRNTHVCLDHEFDRLERQVEWYLDENPDMIEYAEEIYAVGSDNPCRYTKDDIEYADYLVKAIGRISSFE